MHIPLTPVNKSDPTNPVLHPVRRFTALPFWLLLVCLLPVLPCSAIELRSRYAVISYNHVDDLRQFNDELYVGGRLRSQMRQYKADTVEEELVAKINVITEKAMRVLDMYPKPLNFSIMILPDVDAVAKAFKEIYNVEVDYIAFYSPRLNRVFYSADNGRLRVTCHEIGHVVAENYFKVSPPQRIHEVMAQYVEKHIND